MPESEEPQKLDFAPGELGPFDYSEHDFVKLSEDAKKEVLELCRKKANTDLLARRIEVEQAWEEELFYRGYHFLFPRRGGGWQFTSQAAGNRNWSQRQSSGNYETNIFAPTTDILSNALSRDIPKPNFGPANPNEGPDITAADKAEDYVEIFEHNNDLSQKIAEMAYWFCVNGRFLTYTRTVVDGQQFGFYDEADDNPEVPETTGGQEPPAEIKTEGEQEIEYENESPEPESKRKPRGREVTTIIGKLAHKLPLNANTIHECDYVQYYLDSSTSQAKGMFPWIAQNIVPGAGSIGQIGIDRLARINVALAIEGGYQTGDTYNTDCTSTFTWLRPQAYFDCAKPEVKAELFEQCPDGLLCVYVGANDALAFVRNECMDDKLNVEQARRGTGMNRASLMRPGLSVQRRLNNWVDLLNDFFIKTVPRVWMDSRAFNVEALANQTNIPGQRGPFQAQPGIDSQNLMLEEPMPTHQPSLPEFVQYFAGEMMEQITGALPSLAGAETDTDTYRGQALQRDSSLQRLSGPWKAIKRACSIIYRQAVMATAQCREKLGEQTISQYIPGKGKVNLEVADLKGNILSYDDTDSTIPETWTEKSSKYQQLVSEAPENPYIAKLLSLPKNMKMAKDASGLQELDIPEADAEDKQIGEFEILLTTESQPNPDIAKAQEQLQKAEIQAQAEGPEAYVQFQQMKDQALQAIQALPPLVSSVAVMQDASEDHATEAQVCFEKMNSRAGRKLKSTNRPIWDNLHLHWQEHSQMAAKLSPPAPNKPPSPSMSMAVDKLPTELAAQAAAKFYGLDAKPQDFQVQDATETEQNIVEKSADFGHAASGAQ